MGDPLPVKIFRMCNEYNGLKTICGVCADVGAPSRAGRMLRQFSDNERRC